jgi:hypothetical protein
MSDAVTPKVVADAVTPAESTFFATAFIEEADIYNTASDGDLWPCTWSNDNVLYLANGDGKGFDTNATWADIVVNKITGGHPDTRNLAGQRIADSVSRVWADPAQYNRKPTGMVSVNGVLYLAVQDLKKDTGAFDDAPNATILKSTDRGGTWTYNTSAPMFSNYIFTTVMFLDFGKDGVDNVPGSTDDDYVYAYGMDNNWRDSFSNSVPDPTRLYLARISRTSDLQNINNWQFWTGGLDGTNPSWSSGGNISAKTPVFQDDTRVYPNVTPGFPSGNIRNMTELSQGSITYNKPLNRYIYCSWTEYTFEFFESPKPWGPWKKFLSKDFGSYPWLDNKNGGYATVMPSKYISADGKRMWVNANTFMGGINNYNFSLRQLYVTPYTGALANNMRSDTNNLAITGSAKTPITGGSFHQGNPWALNDGIKNVNCDSWNGEAKTIDYWGYTWDKAYNMNKVVYTTGQMFSDGGWFKDIKIQVRQNFNWVDVTGLSMDPGPTPGNFVTYTFTFNDIVGDGVRLIGAPGGTEYFTSISELEVYYANVNPNLISDDSFELQASRTPVSSPWYTEGTATDKGIDINLGFSKTGKNNAFIRTSDNDTWNCIKQSFNVTPNVNYRLTGWIRNSNNLSNTGYFGVRNSNGTVKNEVNFGGLPDYTQIIVDFNSGANSTMTVFGGWWSNGQDVWMQFDDFSIRRR